MIYRTFRWIAGIALRWFYREITIVGSNRIPARGALLVAANHQNALVDSLITAWVVPRVLRMTAKATLVENRFVAGLFKILGVVPLRRASDERASGTATVDRTRNQGAFREILAALRKGEAVLVFPEGKSHNDARLAPLKTGLSRMALQARDDGGIRELTILPLGLIFEDKAAPGSRVHAKIGEPIHLDDWPDVTAAELTNNIEDRLRAVSETDTAGVPPSSAGLLQKPRGAVIRLAAWWGRVTHEVPIRIARRVAIARSTDEGEPAMFTILYGILFVLVSYGVQYTAVRFATGSLLAASLYLASLVWGAYWAAFENHTGLPRSPHDLVSSQLAPLPRSTTSGTERAAAPSISAMTRDRSSSISSGGDSNTSSS